MNLRFKKKLFTMKQKFRPSSNFFILMSLALPCALLLLSSITPRKPQSVKVDNSLAANYMLSCTQADLVICNYGSIEAFVDALVAELNNQLNNCGGALVDCNQTSSCCHYTSAYFTLTSALRNGKNPWYYCTNESCNTFACGVLGGGSQHNDLSVADQDSMLTILRSSAYTTGNTICNGSSGAVSSFYVYRTPTSTPTDPCSSDGPCYNLSIRMRVTYVCTCTE